MDVSQNLLDADVFFEIKQALSEQELGLGQVREGFVLALLALSARAAAVNKVPKSILEIGENVSEP